MKTTNNTKQKVKIYFIELQGRIPALLKKRFSDSPGVYECTLSLIDAIEAQAYYKSKNGLMYDIGQYLQEAGTPFKILSFKVVKPPFYDQKDL